MCIKVHMQKRFYTKHFISFPITFGIRAFFLFFLYYHVPVFAQTSCTLAPKFVQTTVSQGMEYYTDRAYTFTNVPAQYIGLNMIKTPNDDLGLTQATDYMRFTLQNDSTVYVAYDRRGTSLPNWMSGFIDTGDTINTSLSTQQFLKVYRKNYAAGECVNFGANKAPGASGTYYSNYVAFYRPL